MTKKTCVSIFMAILFAGCSSKNFPTGNYQTSKINIDGNANDWGLPLRFGSEIGSLQYNITNDNENLYVCVVTNDKSTQNRILRSGLSIYFDMNGTKNKKISIVFPVINNRQFKAYGFIGLENGVYDISESPLKLAVDNDEYGNLVIETKVPILYLTGKVFTMNSAPNMSVGIVVRNLPAANKSGGYETNRNSSNEAGGMRGGGMRSGGMRSGGMRGGGMRSGGMSGANVAMQEIVNWYQFKLALKK